ncbi:MAG: hypothetical protein Q8M09_02215 [Pseudomonadota bacterium]|nr:hypothetical protein [Pseudomonadota bacterium]MDP1573040.1 hypothetical protein [Pseudomonadota bacterium]MDP1903057.1 hypothetical protein [Pseudomonadota bacterium]
MRGLLLLMLLALPLWSPPTAAREGGGRQRSRRLVKWQHHPAALARNHFQAAGPRAMASH